MAFRWFSHDFPLESSSHPAIQRFELDVTSPSPSRAADHSSGFGILPLDSGHEVAVVLPHLATPLHRQRQRVSMDVASHGKKPYGYL